MTEHKNETTNGCDLATLIKLFGPPPLIGTEKLERFGEMMNQLLACIGSEDVMVAYLIYEAAIETWRIMRWKRYQALMIQRCDRVTRNFEAQRAKRKEQRNEELDSPPELIKGAESEQDRSFALAELREKVLADSEAASDSANETDLVIAFERCIDKVQKAESLINSATERLHDALRQIEWYRTSLAQTLRKKSNEIIEGACKEIKTVADAPPLVPDNEQGS